MKVLVTGGAGFIGSHIVDKLVDQGQEVVVIDNLCSGYKCNLNTKARFYKTPITSTEVSTIFQVEKPQYVIHHAAHIDVQNSIVNPLYDAHVNIVGTINLLENCHKYSVEKIIYASSAAVYGNPECDGVNEQHRINPLSFYGISKYTPELYIQAYAKLHGLTYTILRYSNVYGTRQELKGEGGVIATFLQRLLRGEQPVIFGDGKQTRDFICVSDVVEANLAALLKGDNDIMNISSNQQTSINDLVELMNEVVGTSLPAIYKEGRKGEISQIFLDNEKALTLLGWKPITSLSQGLHETFEYYSQKKRTFLFR